MVRFGEDIAGPERELTGVHGGDPLRLDGRDQVVDHPQHADAPVSRRRGGGGMARHGPGAAEREKDVAGGEWAFATGRYGGDGCRGARR